MRVKKLKWYTSCWFARLEMTRGIKSNHPDYFVGQEVVWLYKARADSNNVQRIPAKVVKLGSKQVQIRVNKHNNEFVNRWVNRDRLENLK